MRGEELRGPSRDVWGPGAACLPGFLGRLWEPAMEPANASRPDGEPHGGVLAHLERLEAQVTESRTKSAERQRARAEGGALGARIQKLRRLRDELRAEVQRRRASVKASTASVQPDQTAGMSEQDVLERRWEHAKAMLQAYRFTGLSGRLTSRGVCVRISTAFEEHLLESYFVDLVIQKPLRILRHSVPVFIPLEKMAAQHLQSDIRHFLFSLCEHLNAYAGRKFQADRLQGDFAAFLTGPLQRNALCSLLSFTYRVDSGAQSVAFSARLLYEDLTVTLPTRVTVACEGTEALSCSWEHQRASHEALFSTKPLHQVFASFAREGEKLDMSLIS